MNVEEDTCDVEALKMDTKQTRREIFVLYDELKEMQDRLAEIREDSV